ncbi:MAG: hypothetical protein ABJC13_08495 [Acidobacteriota bacterium]
MSTSTRSAPGRSSLSSSSRPNRAGRANSGKYSPLTAMPQAWSVCSLATTVEPKI